jgi:hypothetical protein
MSLKDALKKLMFVLPLIVGALGGSTALGQAPMPVAGPACGPAGCGPSCTPAPTCAGHCDSHCCPGPYVHCTPQLPCLKYKKACGKPICDVCDYEGYGYYPTCWRAWNVPVNYVCPVPTPTQLVHPLPQMISVDERMLPSVPQR